MVLNLDEIEMLLGKADERIGAAIEQVESSSPWIQKS